MITHDRDGLSPVQVARINRLQLARYRKPLTEAEQMARAAKVMRRGLVILCILWATGLAAFIYIGGETHHGHAVYVPGGIEVYP
jgi:hypothetical protein